MDDGALQATLATALALWSKEQPQYAVVNVWLFGSRAYGCATDASDYDFLFVVRGHDLFQTPRLIECKSFQINAYHVAYLKYLIEHECVVWASLVCFMPPLLAATGEPLAIRFRLVKNALFQTTTAETAHNMSKAKRLFGLGDEKRAIKNVFHAMRYASWAVRLAEMERIDIADLRAHNDSYNCAMARQWTDWASLQAQFKPSLDATMARLKVSQDRVRALRPPI